MALLRDDLRGDPGAFAGWRFVMTLIAGLAGKPPPCPRHPGTVPQEAQSVNRHPGMKERQGDNGNALQADTQGA